MKIRYRVAYGAGALFKTQEEAFAFSQGVATGTGKREGPSVTKVVQIGEKWLPFETAQLLLGLFALGKTTDEQVCLEAVHRILHLEFLGATPQALRNLDFVLEELLCEEAA